MGNTQNKGSNGFSSLNAAGIGDEDSGWIFEVLEYCDDKTRSSCIFLSKRYTSILTTESAYKWRLSRLHIEYGIYSPFDLPNKESWFSLFLSLFKRRDLWKPNDDSISPLFLNDEKNDTHLCKSTHQKQSKQTFKISVSLRLKPVVSCKKDNNEAIKKVILPLHQRLRLIKLGNNITSNKDALHIMKEQGEWFKHEWERSRNTSRKENLSEDSKENIENDAVENTIECGVHNIDSITGRIVLVDPTKGLRKFEFDNVLPDESSQNSIYESCVKRILCDFMNGINGTCLVYGQTGSGKTFTMFGPCNNNESLKLTTNFQNQGIIPRACTEIFESIQFRKKCLNFDIDMRISVSYVEIYGNEITDLLKGGSLCGNNKASSQRFVMNGAAEVSVRDMTDISEVLSVGEAQKRKAKTAMNERSSRAHSLFIIRLQQSRESTGVTVTSKLFLADLGGSEQTKKSKIEVGRSNHLESLKRRTLGDIWPEFEIEHDEEKKEDDEEEAEFSTGFVQSNRMKEAVLINLGLMSLKMCVEALSLGRPHVPYANSKLTVLLSEGLGGDSQTSVVICASQEKEHVSETLQAIKFGQSCRQISTTAKSGESFLEDIISDVESEIASCEERIRKNERWQVIEEKRIDSLALKDTLEERGLGGIEIRKTTTLVGAEDDRKLLHVLLRKRASLMGNKIDIEIDASDVGGNICFGNAYNYGMGSKFDPSKKDKNDRFEDGVRAEKLPVAIKMRGDTVGWKTGEEIKENDDVLEQRAKTTRRNNLVYSGISA